MRKISGLGLLVGSVAMSVALAPLVGCKDDKGSKAGDAAVAVGDATAATDGATAKDGAAAQDSAAAKDSAAVTADTAAATTADTAAATDGPTMLATSAGTWTVYNLTPPATDAGTPDGGTTDAGTVANAAMNVAGTITAFAEAGGKTRFVLSVTGLPANTTFGSHLHKLACNDTQAGGHYQNLLPPDGGVPADVANNTNEVWLDFTTDATGAGKSETTVAWVPRAGGAKAIVIHAMKTADGGAAGAKLACTSMVF